MKLKHFLLCCCYVLGMLTIQAQTKEPEGAAAKNAIESYRNRDIAGLEKAVTELEKVHPKHPYTLFFKAYVKDAKGVDVNEILRDYSEVIRIAPDFSDPYIYRGQLFHYKGIYQKAIDDYTKAIEIEKGNGPEVYVEFYVLRGESYNRMGNATAAYDDFKSAATLFPSIPRYYRGMLNTAFDAKREQEALSFLQQAVDGKQSQNGGIIEVLADMYLRMQKFSQADEYYTKALAMQGWEPSPDSYSGASIAAERVENFSKAKTLIEKAIQMNPKEVVYYTNRAGIAATEKKWEDVYTWAKKALEVNSNDMYANMYMAVGVKLTGRGDALSAEYEKKAYEIQKQQKQ